MREPKNDVVSDVGVRSLELRDGGEQRVDVELSLRAVGARRRQGCKDARERPRLRRRNRRVVDDAAFPDVGMHQQLSMPTCLPSRLGGVVHRGDQPLVRRHSLGCKARGFGSGGVDSEDGVEKCLSLRRVDHRTSFIVLADQRVIDGFRRRA